MLCAWHQQTVCSTNLFIASNCFIGLCKHAECVLCEITVTNLTLLSDTTSSSVWTFLKADVICVTCKSNQRLCDVLWNHTFNIHACTCKAINNHAILCQCAKIYYWNGVKTNSHTTIKHKALYVPKLRALCSAVSSLLYTWPCAKLNVLHV